MSSFMDVDSNLFDYHAIKEFRKKNTRKRRTNKEKAEFEFDASAPPVKLNHFFLDVMDVTIDEPDVEVELNGSEERAPMIYEPNFYPSNCEELAPDIIESANNFLEFAEKIENEVIPDLKTNEVDQIVQQVAQVQVASMMKDMRPTDQTMRIKTKRLTAKRLAFKALQMFSFNSNFDKHFTMDKEDLRSVNTDMLIDNSSESVEWLKNVGTRYQNIYLEKLKFEFQNDDDIIKNLDPQHSHFRALGFSTILKNVDFELLNHRNIRLGDYFDSLKGSGYECFTLMNILYYFGISIFGVDSNHYQLNYLHLIPYYLQSTKKKKVFDLFSDLDLGRGLFNK